MSQCELCDSKMRDNEARDWLACGKCREPLHGEELAQYAVTEAALRDYVRLRKRVWDYKREQAKRARDQDGAAPLPPLKTEDFIRDWEYKPTRLKDAS